jgi:hypothetical protein
MAIDHDKFLVNNGELIKFLAYEASTELSTLLSTDIEEIEVSLVRKAHLQKLYKWLQVNVSAIRHSYTDSEYLTNKVLLKLAWKCVNYANDVPEIPGIK